jgi:imidazolonepropionase-like amidohydrolase
VKNRRWIFRFLTLLLTPALLAAQEPPVTAFIDVNVLPMDRERVLPRQTVIVRGDRIEALGPLAEIAVPAGARRIEGAGTRWLVPGLADMHTHLASAEDAALYVAGGVTTVLQMGGEGKVESIPYLRGLLSRALAPQVFFAFMIDGHAAQSGGWAVHSVDEARAAVRVAKDRQYDFVKIYNGPTVEQFDAIVDEARQLGLPVIGHGVRSVGLPASLLRGQVMVAHAEEFYYTTFGNKPDRARIAAVAEETRRSGAYVTANLCFIEAIDRQWGRPEVRERNFADPLAQYMSPYSRLVIWASPRRNYAHNAGKFPVSLAFLKAFVGELSRQGVPILAGTDSPLISGLVPGAGLNEELRLLVESGLSSYEALATATRVPGEFMSKYVTRAARFGVVEVGARADLLLVADNPLASLDTLRHPLGVVAGGRLWSAEEMRAVLEKNRREIDSAVRDTFGARAR